MRQVCQTKLEVENCDQSGTFSGIQYIKCHEWDPFVCLFIFHYTAATVSAFTMASMTIERCAVVYDPYMSITLQNNR